mmetsp:Transcript_45622/g.33357  ORF Transcript_45622/g.33357 Transcript_45622/m.33357 type:complete len:150 (-) Transcript_45622:60-509(-)
MESEESYGEELDFEPRVEVAEDNSREVGGWQAFKSQPKLPNRIFEGENQESNLEKVVLQGENMYLVGKETKDKPLDYHIKLPVEAGLLQIKEENVPNLLNIYGKFLSRETDQQVIQALIDLLKEKLRSNLTSTPAIYQAELIGAGQSKS